MKWVQSIGMLVNDRAGSKTNPNCHCVSWSCDLACWVAASDLTEWPAELGIPVFSCCFLCHYFCIDNVQVFSTYTRWLHPPEQLPVSLKSSFPKHAKRHSKKKWACNANVNAKFDYYVLEKRFSLMNKCEHRYIFMKRSFPKHDLQTWHCHCNLDFWIGA